MQRFAFLVNLFFNTSSLSRRPQLLDFVNLFIGEANYSKGLRLVARLFIAAGEFRLLPGGRALLVGMRGASRERR